MFLFSGNARYKDGNYELAVEHFSDGIKVDPSNQAAVNKFLHRRAVARQKLRLYATAISDCTKILEKISDTEVLKLRAALYHANKDLEGAIKDYETILESDAESPLRDTLNKIHKELKAKNELKYHCFVLNVDPSSNYNEIKKQYHRLSLIYHPDKNSRNDKDKFQRLNSAATYFREIEERKKAKKKN